MTTKVIKTKWGTAKVNSKGYYHITSRKEGYPFKKLHRLIYEAYYGQIPDGYHVHHIDGNKLNNRIDNLQLLSKSEHSSLHNSEENHPQWKNYPRIIKWGFDKNKQVYAIRYEGKYLKQSIYLHKLYKWWGNNHPDEFLYLEI
jgi:hypothetical protein